MNLQQRIKVKERQARLARAAFVQSYAELKHVLYRKLSSRTALTVGFTGGLALGWLKGKPRKHKPAAASLTQQARASMPRNWLGSYIIWPFVLASARDLLIARRPGRESS